MKIVFLTLHRIYCDLSSANISMKCFRSPMCKTFVLQRFGTKQYVCVQPILLLILWLVLMKSLLTLKVKIHVIIICFTNFLILHGNFLMVILINTYNREVPVVRLSTCMYLYMHVCWKFQVGHGGYVRLGQVVYMTCLMCHSQFRHCYIHVSCGKIFLWDNPAPITHLQIHVQP